MCAFCLGGAVGVGIHPDPLEERHLHPNPVVRSATRLHKERCSSHLVQDEHLTALHSSSCGSQGLTQREEMYPPDLTSCTARLFQKGRSSLLQEP